MIHGKKQQPVNLRGFAPPGYERDGAASQFLPCDTAKAGDDSRLRNRNLGPQMLAALGDFISGRVAIAAGGVARIASHEIGDKNVFQPRAFDHSAQQPPRTIAAEWNSGAVAAQASGCNPDKCYVGRHAAIARNYARPASNQRLAARASLNQSAQPPQCNFGCLFGGGQWRGTYHRTRKQRLSGRVTLFDGAAEEPVSEYFSEHRPAIRTLGNVMEFAPQASSAD
jgi:hypothetical protein